MRIYNYIRNLLKQNGNKDIAFTMDKSVAGKNIWHFHSDLFWLRVIPTGIFTKKGTFIGFKNSKTGEVVGNYIYLSYRKGSPRIE